MPPGVLADDVGTPWSSDAEECARLVEEFAEDLWKAAVLAWSGAGVGRRVFPEPEEDGQQGRQSEERFDAQLAETV